MEQGTEMRRSAFENGAAVRRLCGSDRWVATDWQAAEFVEDGSEARQVRKAICVEGSDTERSGRKNNSALAEREGSVQGFFAHLLGSRPQGHSLVSLVSVWGRNWC